MVSVHFCHPLHAVFVLLLHERRIAKKELALGRILMPWIDFERPDEMLYHFGPVLELRVKLSNSQGKRIEINTGRIFLYVVFS